MSAWDVTPGGVSPASVDLTVPAVTVTLTAEQLDELVAACEAQLDKSYDLLHPGHGDTERKEAL